ARGEPVLILGGGSNLVVGDAGFDGTVVAIRTSGRAMRSVGERLDVELAAGEPWDDIVAWAVEAELSGIEALSGIPGLVGATPMQNVGAYGQEVKETLRAARVWDRQDGCEVTLTAEECGFAYRSSRLKEEAGRYLVLSVFFSLERSVQSAPIAYTELARELGVAEGARAPLDAVRETVLRLRRSKGMVLDPADTDTVSAGSFFTNPIVSEEDFARAQQRVTALFGPGVLPPRFPAAAGKVKIPAAWLIERAGFAKGYGKGAVGISSKHALALVHRGGGTTAELVALAREVQRGVHEAFGVSLEAEPVLVGCML
ncbi:MAG TPA: UDP-N-acetylmuramate dehydrogenase, partial [Polyangiaceae bacterium]